MSLWASFIKGGGYRARWTNTDGLMRLLTSGWDFGGVKVPQPRGHEFGIRPLTHDPSTAENAKLLTDFMWQVDRDAFHVISFTTTLGGSADGTNGDVSRKLLGILVHMDKCTHVRTGVNGHDDEVRPLTLDEISKGKIALGRSSERSLDELGGNPRPFCTWSCVSQFPYVDMDDLQECAYVWMTVDAEIYEEECIFMEHPDAEDTSPYDIDEGIRIDDAFACRWRRTSKYYRNDFTNITRSVIYASQ